MYVDDIRIAIEVHVPDLFGNCGPRENISGIARQERYQRELLLRQIQSPAGAHRSLPREIHFEVCDAD